MVTPRAGLPGERGRLVARVGRLIGGNKRPRFRILGMDFGHHHYDEWIAIMLLGKPSADFLINSRDISQRCDES